MAFNVRSLTLLIVAILFAVSFSAISLNSGEGAPVRSDSVANDSFETATEIQVRVTPYVHDLDPLDVDDHFKIMDLVGDTYNDQLDCQNLIVGLKKTSGAGVKGIIYEPNGLKIGEIYSDGEREELEFIVPYDGDYFLWVETSPRGSTSGYEIHLGGESGVDNRPYDKNNKPPGVGITGSVNITNGLNPGKDVVDYAHLSILPSRAMEATLLFQGDLPFKLQVLNSTQHLITEVRPNDPYRIENNGDTPVDIIFRVYLPLSTEGAYSSTTKTYNLGIDVWSHLTQPRITPGNNWSIAHTNEDTKLAPNINLTQHFNEPNGDPIWFGMVGESQNLEIRIIEFVNDKKESIGTEVEVTPLSNWYGTEILTFKCSDRDGFITDHITIEVSSVNDLSYITRIGGADYEGGEFNMFALEDETKVYEVVYHDDDHNLSQLHFSTSGSPDFLSLEPSNGTMTITPSQEDVGMYNFTLLLMDPEDSISVEVNLDVQHVNDAPLPPTINIIAGNMSHILPGEEITLEAVVEPDPDGDDLTFTWTWGDERSDIGRTVSHIYSMGIYGNRTIRLTVSDGRLTSNASIVVFLERSEDLADGDLSKIYSEIGGDALKFQEEWRINFPEEERDFKVFKIEEDGVDIIGLSCLRRVNDLEVTLKVKDSIQVDGSFRYFLYIIRPNDPEPYVDYQNLSSWDLIPDRAPLASNVITYREYVGDPNLHNTSTGVIVNQNSLVWVIPFSELVDGGLTFPIAPESFGLFAVTEHLLGYGESKGIAERYIITDTAGEGSLVIGPIQSGGSTSGGGSSYFADLSRPTQLGVVIGLLVIVLILFITSSVLLKRWIKKKKKEEDEFIKHVEKLNDEGKDLFGKEQKNKESRRSSYGDLYGTSTIQTRTDPTTSSVDTLPAIGLDIPGSTGPEKIEIKVNWGDDKE